MPLLNSQIRWQGMAATVVVDLLILLTLAFAVVSYVEWSSNTVVAEFMRTAEQSASDPNHSRESSARPQSQGPTGCPVGRKALPTQLAPLP
ncbi:hypothetical protein CQ14_18730 [Bradyrhizobium lablabi]|uniref:Uncharacterized protein n=1 Tax=Bradyrhizobium lablabi TaxID=722472 RepID=A0A0R3MFV3_9BRAD|nr:hypothetical protein [Bradyrhizobium lablabi]KRR18929.1 hypothetical protein CQ14_18730 [Bradyrhizobium lablabi]